MQRPAPPAFPIFRSKLTVAALVLTYLGAGEYSVAELARAAQTDRSSMLREVNRLDSAAVTRSRLVGKSRLVRANRDAPFYQALHDLVTITLGPAHVLAEELSRLTNGIGYAAVFGSWAARTHGEPGPAPTDIDLLVVGRPDRDDLHDAARRASIRLGREVNVVLVAPDRWESSNDSFLAELRARPRVAVFPSGTLPPEGDP